MDQALGLVLSSRGLGRCRQLAQVRRNDGITTREVLKCWNDKVHAEKAIEAIQILTPSSAKDALTHLACKVVTRKH